MGYTHYFDGVQMSKELAAFADRAVRESKVKICGPFGAGNPEITNTCIRINGCQEEGEDYESFLLPADEFSGYCKTARRPYDEVVTAILIAAIVLKVPGWTRIWSDGDAYDWQEQGGVDLFRLTWMKLGHGLYEEAPLMKALQAFLVSRDESRCDETQRLLEKARPKDTPATEAPADETIEIRYHSDELVRLERIEGKKSDWIDLRAAENVTLRQGDFALISLGISVKLPEGYEMIIVPRSSTFKNFGILQTNSMGVVDESYCGDSDIIKFPALAMRDTEIHVNDRICQFRILRHQPEITFAEKEHLGGKDRGGFGSTGKA